VPSLFVIQGRDQGKRFELQDRVLGIGRDPSNRIRLHDTEVSRRHAELHRVEDGYRWVDLGSSNGSFVNSIRVDKHPLRSGDRVQIGRTLMIFTDSVDAAPVVSRREVDIVGSQGELPDSRIVHAVRQEEGTQFLTQVDDNDSPWLARARSNLQVMYRTALAVSHTMDIEQLLQRIMELIFEWVEADRGCVMLLDRDTDELVPKVRRDRHQSHADDQMTISRTILDYVRSHQEGVLTSDAKDDDRWDPAASILKMGVREAICVPMQGRYGIVGVIYIDTFTPPANLLHQRGPSKRFTDEHLKLMVAIGHQAALAVEDTSYYSAMVQAERLAAMGQTIAGLSHHVKNILQGMRGGSFLIQEGLKAHDWEVAGKGWAIVEKNQERISNLVMDMLTFSKEREPEMLPSDLNEVVGDVLELMQSRADDQGVRLVDLRDPAVPRMTFDPEGIHRAVLNVVTNAIDACVQDANQTPRGGDDDEPWNDAWGEDEAESLSSEEPTDDARALEVSIRTEYRASDRKLVIYVTDSGPGISPEGLKKIFNVFVSSKGNRGTGLGLPVSQKILEEHGGQIVVESELGKGSCFRLELPAHPTTDATGSLGN
jgi:signal transduction histidine kinase/pSer/pThr/pTyr-binding forkhead associated (FHA) protein